MGLGGLGRETGRGTYRTVGSCAVIHAAMIHASVIHASVAHIPVIHRAQVAKKRGMKEVQRDIA